MLVCTFFFYPWHTRPPVQRASGIPCSLIWGDNDRKTSGDIRRENADVYLVFENRIEKLVVPDKRATRALIRDLYAVTPMATGSASELVEASRSDNR